MSSGVVYGAGTAENENTNYGRSSESLPIGDNSRSVLSGGDATTATTGVPEVFQLNFLCSRAFAPGDDSEEAKFEADESWERVREWLRTHSATEIKDAAEARGENNMTALHFAARNGPPLDIIEVLLSIAGETANWPDNFGWLPLHYCCACGAAPSVVKKLGEKYPETKTQVDRRGRTALIFAIGISGNNPDLVAALSSTGAAALCDDNGMLPLHYACATGASEETLLVLTNAHHDAIHTRDVRNRTPLHFALTNAARPASPGAVRHLLNLDPDLVNGVGGSPLPIRVLSEYANTIGSSSPEQEEGRDNVQKCLEYVLAAEPTPTAAFFTALQGLPNWLSERAVVMPTVQHLLNEKIAQRFPTMMLLLDFYFLIIVVVAYSINVIDAIQERFNPDTSKGIIGSLLVLQYVSVAYFIIREMIQIISLVSLKALHVWFKAASNWLNVVFIVLVLTFSILMTTGGGDDYKFRTGAAVTIISIYLRVFVYLRTVSLDFAVFVGGVIYIVRRLVAFLVCLGIILIAFAQMWLTVYDKSEECSGEAPVDRLLGEVQCEEAQTFPYCDAWPAFLNVLTMLLGEVDEKLFTNDLFATILFVFFMFLVVIILATVLIAIVTDSYKVIQDQRASIVFWTNRLDFVSAMDPVANGPWKKRMKKCVGMSADSEDDNVPVDPDVSFGADFWRRLIYLFEDDIDGGAMSLEFWIYLVLRVVAALIIIPSWLALGVLTCGWLWPPQIREAIFTSDVSKHSSDSAEQDALRKSQVANLEKEVRELEIEFGKELALGRTQIVEIKSSIAGHKTDMTNEMKHIRRVIATLFDEQQSEQRYGA